MQQALYYSKQQYIHSATLVKCIKDEIVTTKFKSWMSPLKATVLERTVWHSQSTKTTFLETWMVYLKVTVISYILWTFNWIAYLIELFNSC